MESWLTIEGFDEPLILSKLEAIHKVGIESTYKAHWEKKDPRSINNTTRPSDYALAVWVREIIHSMFYPR